MRFFFIVSAFLSRARCSFETSSQGGRRWRGFICELLCYVAIMYRFIKSFIGDIIIVRVLLFYTADSLVCMSQTDKSSDFILTL